MEIDPCSKEYIGYLLATNDRAVEQAIVCIYNRQTEDEQFAQDTRHKNGRGFTAGDARIGSYLAKYVLTGKHLSGDFLFRGKCLILKYIGQLVQAAEMKRDRLARQAEADSQAKSKVIAKLDAEVAEELAILHSEVESV